MAFQVTDYAKQFTCISLDPRGAGESDKPGGTWSTELFAGDVAAIGLDRVHVAGLSLGATIGMWLAAKHPERVKSLSLHTAWVKSDPYLKVVVQGCQTMARDLGSVTEVIIHGTFPWCFTPELGSAKRDYVEALATFVRGRPTQPLAAFLQQSEAVFAHDAAAPLSLAGRGAYVDQPAIERRHPRVADFKSESAAGFKSEWVADFRRNPQDSSGNVTVIPGRR